MALKSTSEINQECSTFGRFLKDQHLNELPQFINVLHGDMSIIGPKSYSEKESLKY